MITALTPEQEAKFPEYVEKWVSVGLSTEPADRPAAEKAMLQAYRSAGLAEPKYIVWLDSPYLGAVVARKLASLKNDVASREEFDIFVSAAISQMDSKSGPETQSIECGYGLHDAGWAGWASFMIDELGLSLPEALPFIELSKTCGWWWPFDEAVVMTERPCFLSRDEQHNLHCENRAALEYRDGRGVYSWHGVVVPKEVILHPESITWQAIDNQRNAEVRRVMMTRYGVDKYARDSGAEVVQKDRYGVFYRRKLEDGSVFQAVEVTNSTPEPDGSFKKYWIRTPSRVKTAHEAVAGSFNMTAEEYSPQVET